MKQNKFFYTIIASVALAASVTSCDDVVVNDSNRALIMADNISINTKNLDLCLGATSSANLSAVITPTNATVQEVEWASTEPTVATVDANGKVTANKDGVAFIVASTQKGTVTDTCKVTVTHVATEEVVIPAELKNVVLNFGVNSTLKLTANIFPSNAGDKNVTWTSLDETIAKVDRTGTVTAIKDGEVDIVVTNDGKTDVCHVVVTHTPVTEVVLNFTTLTLKEAQRETLTATAMPEDAYDKTIKWSSSNTNIVTVTTEGVIYAAHGGKAVIYATSVDGTKAACEVTVTPNEDVTFKPYEGTEKWN